MATSSTLNDNTTTTKAAVPPPKRKHVDDAFQRLFGYKWGTTFDISSQDIQDATVKQLVEIFGTTRAARILGMTDPNKRRKTTSSSSAATTPSRAKLDYKSIELPKAASKTITETKMFAGQAIRTKKVVAATDAPTQKKPPATGLDSVLQQLEGPSKINTVEKTSSDWESFKEKDKTLQDELEKQAKGKGAYLVRQDFLNRVDQRTFEKERDDRERERAKRGMN